tara:strand:+ start:362 stop:676 length:315 start_codon:yes stop_codon:yes gene_type:complete
MSSNDNEQLDKWFQYERRFYYAFLTSAVCLLFFLTVFGAKVLNKHLEENRINRISERSANFKDNNSKKVEYKEYSREEDLRYLKPLPDYMLEDISPDELEYLKP